MSDKTTDPPPAEIWAPAPCPRCGARTEREAEAVCKPGFDETGEHVCPGSQQDAEGRILQPSPEYLAALDAWIERQPHD